MAAPQLSDQAAMAEAVDPDSVASHLKCSCCTELVFNAYQTPHGCRICQNCFNTKLKDTEKIRCPGNTEACRDDDDEIMISRENCFPDIATRREIGKLECHYKLESPNSNHGCGQVAQWRKWDNHCVLCPHCQDQTVGQLTRRAYLEHLVNCKDKPHQCKFAHTGCSFMGKRQDLAKHYEDSMDYHLELMNKMIQQHCNNQQAAPTAAGATGGGGRGGTSNVSNSEIDKAVRNFTIQYAMFEKLQINVANLAHTPTEFKESSDKYDGVLQLRTHLQSLNDRLDRLPALRPAASAAAAAAWAAGPLGRFSPQSRC